MHKEGVCEDDFRLTSTDLEFTGTLSGGLWEGTGSIQGIWTGGDYACDNLLTLADGYPNQGTFTIVKQQVSQ